MMLRSFLPVIGIALLVTALVLGVSGPHSILTQGEIAVARLAGAVGGINCDPGTQTCSQTPGVTVNSTVPGESCNNTATGVCTTANNLDGQCTSVANDTKCCFECVDGDAESIGTCSGTGTGCSKGTMNCGCKHKGKCTDGTCQGMKVTQTACTKISNKCS